MASSLEFLLGFLDQDDPVFVAREDFDGAHGEAVRLFQAMGFLGHESGASPVPSCPHCGGGVPYRLQGRYVCDACHGSVEPREFAVWQFDRQAFFVWLAAGLRLKGGVRPIGERLWQLGAWEREGGPCECFFIRGGPASAHGQSRLDAYRNVLVFYGLTRPANAERFRRCISLVELLRVDETITVAGPARLLRPRGTVRFDAASGSLWVGDVWLGDVPPGSKEFHFLRCLAEQIDRYVAYADIKHDVLRRSGGSDSRDEATFCQRLKSRIKKKAIPQIDQLVVTTNKADGYRLRGRGEL